MYRKSRITQFLFAQFCFVTGKFTPIEIDKIIFGIMRFGIDDPRPHLSSVGGKHEMMSLPCNQSCMWIDHIVI
jgi:hypothetical protein